MVEGGGGEGVGTRLQVDSWEDGFGRHLMVVALRRGEGTAWMVSCDPSRRIWEAGSGHVIGMGRRRQDRAAMADLVAWGDASVADVTDLGAFGDAGELVRRVVRTLAGDPPSPVPGRPRARYSLGPSRGEGVDGLALNRGRYGFGAGGRNMLAVSGGVREIPPGSGELGDGWLPVDGDAAPSPEPTGTSTVVPLDPDRIDRDALRNVANRLVALAFDALATPGDREAFALLGPDSWTPDAHAFYSRPGAVGDRRRQAGRLYPALAPMLARTGEIPRLVDSGRPYEGELAEVLRETVERDVGERLTVAAVRRLRHLSPGGLFQVQRAVSLATALPVDWLPGDATGWEALMRAACPLQSPCRRMGLELADLAHAAGGDWAAVLSPLADPAHEGAGRGTGGVPMPPGLRAMRDAQDMASYLARTLVSQVRASLGLDPDRPADVRVAGRALFGGRSLAAVDRIQERWHRRATSLDAALPSHEEGNAWPAAFPPFLASNGLTVACLTDEAMLKDEGMEGPGRDGVEGLSHCVGGYGRQCYVGTSHVASVRRVSGDGFERVSTVELALDMHGASGSILSVVQHMGACNEEPPGDAVDAMSELRAALVEGTHTLHGEAMAARSEEGFRESYDWRTGGLIEQAFEAWRPHLPAGVAQAGLDGIREAVSREAERVAALEGDGPDGAMAAGPRP